jgi:hypothetical protein
MTLSRSPGFAKGGFGLSTADLTAEADVLLTLPWVRWTVVVPCTALHEWEVLAADLPNWLVSANAKPTARVIGALSYEIEARDPERAAVRHAELALRVHRDTGHRLGEARTLRALGEAGHGTGFRERAAETVRRDRHHPGVSPGRLTPMLRWPSWTPQTFRQTFSGIMLISSQSTTRTTTRSRRSSSTR